MEFGMQQSVCPRCGSAANVRTIQELVDMIGAMQEQGLARHQAQHAQRAVRRAPETDFGGGVGGGHQADADIGEGITDLVLSAAAHLIGRTIGRRVQRTMNERVVPTLEARAEQARQEQIAIAQKYPELRCCMSDQVIFLDGGTRIVPLTEVIKDITLARADAVVAQLRAP